MRESYQLMLAHLVLIGFRKKLNTTAVYLICFLFIIDLFCLNCVPEMGEAVGVASEANLHSLPTVDDPNPEQTTSDVDTKPHSARNTVIFPNHLHVPEAFKNSLMFGSLESSLGERDDSGPRDASIGTNIEVSKEPSAM